MAFFAGTVVSFFTLPVWVTFAINVAKEGSRADWLSFAGGIFGGFVTLLAASIAWSAVQNQIAAAREVATTREREVWSVLRSDLADVIAKVNSVWKHIDRALLDTTDESLRRWRMARARASFGSLPVERQIQRLETFSKDLGAVKNRQSSMIFYDLNQMAMLAKKWPPVFYSREDEDENEEPDANEPEEQAEQFDASQLAVMKFWMTSFYGHLRRLDAGLAAELSERRRDDVRRWESRSWLEKRWYESEKLERLLFPHRNNRE